MGEEPFINYPRLREIFTFTVWETLRKGLFVCLRGRPSRRSSSENFCTSAQNYCDVLDVIYVQLLWESPDKPWSPCTCSSSDKWTHYVSHCPRARAQTCTHVYAHDSTGKPAKLYSRMKKIKSEKCLKNLIRNKKKRAHAKGLTL